VLGCVARACNISLGPIVLFCRVLCGGKWYFQAWRRGKVRFISLFHEVY
jgi:hypothetical protein